MHGSGLTSLLIFHCLFLASCKGDSGNNIGVSIGSLKSFQLPTPPSPSPRQQRLARFGKKLFFDKRLSESGQISCATCHRPELSFTDGLVRAKGTGPLHLNTPTVINSQQGVYFFWDGRVDSLAAQALQPIEHPSEHGISRGHVVAHLLSHHSSEYVQNFGTFPPHLKGLHADLKRGALPPPQNLKMDQSLLDNIVTTIGNPDWLQSILSAAKQQRPAVLHALTESGNPSSVPDEWILRYSSLSRKQQRAVDEVFFNFGRAVTAYQLNLIANQSPFDQFLKRAGQHADVRDALNRDFGQPELRGFGLFTGKGKCHLCHSGPYFTDGEFHNIGLSQLQNAPLHPGRAGGVLKLRASRFKCMGAEYFGAAVDDRWNEGCAAIEFLRSDHVEILGAFKTPGLRNLIKTAPYFHDGRAATLREVITHYLTPGRPAVGHREETLAGIRLETAEIDDLIAFLHSLESPVIDLADPAVALSPSEKTGPSESGRTLF